MDRGRLSGVGRGAGYIFRACATSDSQRCSCSRRAVTVADLVEELKAREARYAAAFEDVSALRVALDQELSDFSAPLAGVREVAFFPPMTGG